MYEGDKYMHPDYFKALHMSLSSKVRQLEGELQEATILRDIMKTKHEKALKDLEK